MPDKPRIYLDNAAATAVDERVLHAMEPFWRENIGNTGALHKEGVEAARAVEQSRKNVASILNAHEDEILFTSGGTESNNLAILGAITYIRKERKDTRLHVITSAIEHSSVRDCFERLRAEGAEVTIVPVDETGRVNISALEQALRPETALVSCMYANNEIGTIEDMKAVVNVVQRFSKKNKGILPLVHTDACQAAPWLPLNVEKLGIDLLSIDSQKIHGPKGAGILYRRRGVSLEPLFCGGGQEFGLRPGTPPTPLIVGTSTALQLIADEMHDFVPRVTELRNAFVSTILEHIPNALYNGPDGSMRVAGNANISFPGIDGEQFVLELDAEGVAASTRSACLKGNEPGSYVIEALCHSRERALSAVRFTLSRYTTKAEMEAAAKATIDVVRRLDESKQ